jgi:hypothetical protein
LAQIIVIIISLDKKYQEVFGFPERIPNSEHITPLDCNEAVLLPADQCGKKETQKKDSIVTKEKD